MPHHYDFNFTQGKQSDGNWQPKFHPGTIMSRCESWCCIHQQTITLECNIFLYNCKGWGEIWMASTVQHISIRFPLTTVLPCSCSLANHTLTLYNCFCWAVCSKDGIIVMWIGTVPSTTQKDMKRNMWTRCDK